MVKIQKGNIYIEIHIPCMKIYFDKVLEKVALESNMVKNMLEDLVWFFLSQLA